MPPVAVFINIFGKAVVFNPQSIFSYRRRDLSQQAFPSENTLLIYCFFYFFNRYFYFFIIHLDFYD